MVALYVFILVFDPLETRQKRSILAVTFSKDQLDIGINL